MRKKYLYTALQCFLLFFSSYITMPETVIAAESQSHPAASVKGVVGNLVVTIGLGLWLEISGNGETKFVLDETLAKKHGLIFEKNGQKFCVNRLKGKMVELFYDNNQKEKNGYRYYTVIDLKELE